MQLKDFKIGDKFYTAAGEWTVTDVGTRTVVAYNSSELGNLQSWDIQDDVVFYEYDFGGCSLVSYPSEG